MTEHILVPLDGSAFAAAALPHAAALARMFGARLTLAQVPEAMVVPIADAGVWLTRVVESSAARDEAERELAAAASSPELDGLEVRTTTPDYPVAEGLLGAIEEVGADLVVMTSHGRSAPGQWLLGNVAQKLLHHAPVPVYLVRPSQAAEAPPVAFDRILVPLDGSHQAEAAIEPAVALAQGGGGALHLMRIPTIPGYVKIIPETAGLIPDLLRQKAGEAQDYLAEQTSALRGRGLDVEADVEIILSGDLARGILDFADDHQADVIAMTTHGRSDLGRLLLGSTADRIIRGASTPIWIQRPS